jgi:hypothetical protein
MPTPEFRRPEGFPPREMMPFRALGRAPASADPRDLEQQSRLWGDMLAAAVFATLALLWSLVVLHVLPGMAPDAAAALRWTDVLASLTIALMYAYVVVRAWRAGAIGNRGLLAFLLACGAAYVFVVVLQLVDRPDLLGVDLDVGSGSSGTGLTLSKQLMIVPFAVMAFRFFDPARLAPDTKP